MPIKPENKGRYPKDWKTRIRPDILKRANNKCEFCGIENYSIRDNGSRVVLTIAHLDHIPEHCDYSNLRALCQKCHNNYDKEHRKETRMKKLKPCRKWLDHADDVDAKFGRHVYMCPRCNHNADYFIGGTENWWCAEAPNYCPNCGCEMIEESNR